MRQVRTIRYRDIAADLRRRVDEGEFAAGRLLPSESALSATYSASRVTIRKALEDLRSEGLVDSRQGFGWFVAGPTVRWHPRRDDQHLHYDLARRRARARPTRRPPATAGGLFV